MTKDYSYELLPNPTNNGGGWLLRLLFDGQELGQRLFPTSDNIEDKQLASDTAHDEALSAVTTWLTSVYDRNPSERPRPALDESGIYLLYPDDWLLMPPHSDTPERVILSPYKDDASGDVDA